MDPTLSSKIDRILERAIGVKLPSNTLSHSTRPDRPLQNLDHDQSIAGVKLPPSSTLSNAPTQTTTVDGKAIKYEIHSAHIAQGPSRSSDLDSASQSLSPEPAPQSSRTSPKKKVRRKQHDLDTFGHIPGIKVGATWATRLECSRHGVHAPSLAGIHGHKEKGCFSIVMSGMYEDDVDEGDWFTYTGTGGRTDSRNRGKLCEDLPQSFDQTFEHPQNASLLQSYVTRKPVRVVRGFKATYGPRTGYRYDGLYIVEDADYRAGKHGYQVCTFTFRRMGGQHPLPAN